MRKKLTEIFTDIRTWIIILTFILAISANFMGFWELPSRVDALEDTTSENKSSVDKLADTIDNYIATQKTYAKTQEILRTQQIEHDKELRKKQEIREQQIFVLIQEIRHEKNGD